MLRPGAGGAEFAEVDAQRLEHGHGVVDGEDVGGGENAGVLGGDRCGGCRGDGVEIGLEDGPGVAARPVLLVEGGGVDRGLGCAGAGQEVGDVLLLDGGVGADAQPGESTSTTMSVA
ncbi:hypothetical protein QRX60_44410 [Amycolatopsis mongoliensis]|uniref:Uncharacterized protein n=1 Tax=Amycolatopsis mongoliensis TaxID=715475 RepID=A0A9Y2K336_9PSEU|nr:hypothetical protein [Amycolatopsis sp. 4-36]WIY07669.1 hypothetical protein QRX60_44410 [Amycolatopsis sp. 4-36]